MNTKKYRRMLQDALRGYPEFVFRVDPIIWKLTGLSPKTLAVLDSTGKGVKKRMYIGKMVAYGKEDFIEFAVQRHHPFKDKSETA